MVLTHPSLQAQAVYRVVGADGRVTFSDKPPVNPGKATPLESDTKEPAASGSNLPYELRQIASKYPATLYTSKECAPCDTGRNLLRKRGVPFSEKTITTMADSQAYERLSNSNSLPLLTLGGQQITGFNEADWVQYLGAAGYPEKSRLPSGYRNPAPAPLVAVQQTSGPTPAASEPASAPMPLRAPVPETRVNPANPAGIQF
jgi:glutaredoxin